MPSSSQTYAVAVVGGGAAGTAAAVGAAQAGARTALFESFGYWAERPLATRTILSGNGDEIIELAKSNLRQLVKE